MSTSNGVWVWAEVRKGRLMDASLELMNKGLQLSEGLGTGLDAVLIGEEVAGLAEALIAYGASQVYLVEDPRLAFYQSGVYARVLADLAGQHGPEILLLGATTIGMDLAPRVAAKLKTGLTAHCVDLYMEEVQGKPLLVAVVPGFGGNLMVKIVCPQMRPQMATVRQGVMEKPARDEARRGEIIQVAAAVRDEDLRAQTMEVVEEVPTGVPLEQADIVVAGGWGLQAAGGFQPVEELARVLGAAVAGTRPAVDKGWVAEERMIGQSGKTVSPKLFISLGASGAMHYTTGFLRSRVILAIDKNPKAPIFEVADIGIVGDLTKIVPCLVQELQQGGA